VEEECLSVVEAEGRAVHPLVASKSGIACRAPCPARRGLWKFRSGCATTEMCKVVLEEPRVPFQAGPQPKRPTASCWAVVPSGARARPRTFRSARGLSRLWQLSREEEGGVRWSCGSGPDSMDDARPGRCASGPFVDILQTCEEGVDFAVVGKRHSHVQPWASAKGRGQPDGVRHEVGERGPCGGDCPEVAHTVAVEVLEGCAGRSDRSPAAAPPVSILWRSSLIVSKHARTLREAKLNRARSRDKRTPGGAMTTLRDLSRHLGLS
jgi:hypothetical protein